MRTAARELAEQAEASYKRMVKDQQAGAPARTVKVGASATPSVVWQKKTCRHA
jgi:hypothetical protein